MCLDEDSIVSVKYVFKHKVVVSFIGARACRIPGKSDKNQTLLEELFRRRLGSIGFSVIMVRYPTLGRIPTIGTACPRSFGLERCKKIIYRPGDYCGVVRGH